ncbi:MAG: MurR/RpiR family transcriptional regulator [Mesorhizobium sp.]|nr:MAG: MurR/RpiR family transcriptional regulator [Mesorhizobium sp.]
MRKPRHTQKLLLDIIYDAINTAPNALARIALYVAQDPEAVLALSIADLARNTATGSASIVRFCRTLGLSGFREFKIALSGEIERRKLSGELAERAPSEADRHPQFCFTKLNFRVRSWF